MTTTTKAAPKMFVVPQPTKAHPCRACGKLIYFVAMPSGKKMPVNCHVEGGVHPISGVRDGSGISHFADCSKADTFRKAR